MATATMGELKIEHVAIDSLRPDPANPRRIGERELESLTRSLQEFGFVQPVLVRKSDNVVIGGHQRLVAARRLGWKTVPVVFLDLGVEQAIGGGCGRLRGGREASVTQVTPQVAVEGDEFGMVNVVVKPDLYERQRSLVRTEPFVIVRGELQRRDGR
jgi:hypothetical protein